MCAAEVESCTRGYSEYSAAAASTTRQTQSPALHFHHAVIIKPYAPSCQPGPTALAEGSRIVQCRPRPAPVIAGSRIASDRKGCSRQIVDPCTAAKIHHTWADPACRSTQVDRSSVTRCCCPSGRINRQRPIHVDYPRSLERSG